MLNGYEPFILIAVILLVFGSSQIPKLAKNLGRAQHEFKQGISDGQREGEDASSTTDSAKDS